MLNRFMITAATVALIAGTGFANAQGTGTSPGSSGGSTAQQAPSSASPAPAATQPSGPSGMKSTQSEEKMQGGKNQRAQDEMKSGKDAKSAQDNIKQDNIKGEKSKGMSSQNEKGPAGKDKDMKAEGREDRDRDGNMKAEGREDRDRMKAEGREGRDRDGRMKAEGREGTENKSQTTGQAGAGARLTTEQRTRITSVIREQRVSPVNNVNFTISVGTRVPREIGFHPLPTQIISIYPEWRGYEFFLVRDQIVVVDPRTLEIVAVLDA
jgi:Protein of unknown function (DUF1236)